MVSSLDPSYPKRFTQVTFEVSGCHEHREDGAHTIVVVLLRGELLTTQPRHDLVELRSDLRPSFDSFQFLNLNEWWKNTSKSTLKHIFVEFGMRFFHGTSTGNSCQATCRWWQSFVPMIWRRHNLKMLTGSYWGRCLLKWKMRFRTCKQIFTTSIRSNHLYKQIMTINHLGELPTRLGELFWSNWKNQGDYPVWLLHLQTIDEKFWFGHWANCGYLNSMPHGHQKNNPPRVLPEVLSQEIRADPPWFAAQEP